VGSPRNIEYRPVGQNPWWIPPFLGGVPAGLSPEHLRLLGVLTFAMFFEHYDFSLLGNALPQLAATFGLSKGALGDFTRLVSFVFGAVGIIGNPVAGRMADRFGRRRVIIVALMAFPALVATFYAGPARFLVLPWTAMVFTNMAIGVMLRALATELFPTAFRGAAGGTLALLETLGAVAWLFLYSRAMDRLGNQQLVIPLLSLATIVAAGAVFFVPETARRELEQISDEGASRTKVSRR
jgi:MFS family permease